MFEIENMFTYSVHTIKLVFKCKSSWGPGIGSNFLQITFKGAGSNCTDLKFVVFVSHLPFLYLQAFVWLWCTKNTDS